MKPIKHKLTKLTDNIFILQIKDQWDLAMTFLRAQEYYESGNPKFKGKSFDIWDYMKWYATSRDYCSNSFTYPSDWAAFNIPVKVIDSCYKKQKFDTTPYDVLMKSLLDQILQKHGAELDKAYIIGVNDMEDPSLLHEVSHALWYTDNEYKKESKKLIKQLPGDVLEMSSSFLLKRGYAKTVLLDEVNAYFSTGDVSLLLGTGSDELGEPFKANLDKFTPKKLHDLLRDK